MRCIIYGVRVCVYVMFLSTHQDHTQTRLHVKTHLQIADRPVERIVAQPAFLVQKFARFAVQRRTEQTIVEALLQFLCERANK